MSRYSGAAAAHLRDAEVKVHQGPPQPVGTSLKAIHDAFLCL